MKVYTLKKEQFVGRSRKDVFAFFERPENLTRLTPGSLGFNILTPSPIVMKEGALIDYTIRLLFFHVHWRTLISTHEPPHRFVDEQLRGPYLFWHHTHTFEEKEGGTLISDEVRYVLPFGFLGRIAHKLLIKKQLDNIFAFRADIIKNIFEQNNSNADPAREIQHEDEE